MDVVAMPIYRSRIAPAFDFSQKVLVVELQDKEGQGTELLMQGLSNRERIEVLFRAGVTTLICGGISDGLHTMLKNRGFQVVWGIAGPFDEVLQAYRSGRLAEERFQMPGGWKNEDPL